MDNRINEKIEELILKAIEGKDYDSVSRFLEFRLTIARIEDEER